MSSFRCLAAAAMSLAATTAGPGRAMTAAGADMIVAVPATTVAG